MKALALIFAVLLFGSTLFAQSKPAAINDFAAEKALAKSAQEAHGGDKLRGLKSSTFIGSVDITSASIPQAIPATFVMVFAGDKYRVEINNPFQPLKQAFDGSQTISTVPNGFQLPPFNRVGFPLLQRVGEQGFIVTSIPDGKKKKSFRVTTPEGYVTDFFLDEKTNQVKGYESFYSMNGRQIKTSVEFDKMKLVDGVTLPEKYVQRFDLDQLTFYAAFNAKQISLNMTVEADVFNKVN